MLLLPPKAVVGEVRCRHNPLPIDMDSHATAVRYVTSGSFGAADYVEGWLIGTTFFSGTQRADRWLHGIFFGKNFISGVMVNGVFLPCVIVDAGLVPGIFLNNEFVPGVFITGVFTPGLFLENRFNPGILEDYRFCPGLYDGQCRFINGLFYSNTFVPLNLSRRMQGVLAERMRRQEKINIRIDTELKRSAKAAGIPIKGIGLAIGEGAIELVIGGRIDHDGLIVGGFGPTNFLFDYEGKTHFDRNRAVLGALGMPLDPIDEYFDAVDDVGKRFGRDVGDLIGNEDSSFFGTGIRGPGTIAGSEGSQMLLGLGPSGPGAEMLDSLNRSMEESFGPDRGVGKGMVADFWGAGRRSWERAKTMGTLGGLIGGTVGGALGSRAPVVGTLGGAAVLGTATALMYGTYGFVGSMAVEGYAAWTGGGWGIDTNVSPGSKTKIAGTNHITGDTFFITTSTETKTNPDGTVTSTTKTTHEYVSAGGSTSEQSHESKATSAKTDDDKKSKEDKKDSSEKDDDRKEEKEGGADADGGADGGAEGGEGGEDPDGGDAHPAGSHDDSQYMGHDSTNSVAHPRPGFHPLVARVVSIIRLDRTDTGYQCVINWPAMNTFLTVLSLQEQADIEDPMQRDRIFLRSQRVRDPFVELWRAQGQMQTLADILRGSTLNPVSDRSIWKKAGMRQQERL